ncbi:MAG: Clp protease N-terminal domain-containing protein [Candidatus Limnocylindria bacterium]
MGPFDRFDDRAKRVLALAQDEAIRFNHNYIGTEHLLLGLVEARAFGEELVSPQHILLALLGEGEGIAARVLQSFGVTRDEARRRLGGGDAPT